jgi:alpha-glucosidase
MYGDKILVCPVLEPNAKGRRMYVPRGKWFNFWNDDIIKGGKEMWVDADIDSMPIFIKEGAVIPKYPIQQFVDQKNFDVVTLDVYYKQGKEDSTLYDDAHDGYDYTKGRYSLRTFKLTGRTNELIIQQHKEGKYSTEYGNFNIKFHGLPFNISKIMIDNENISIDNLKVNGSKSIVIGKDFSQLHLIGEKE